MTRLPGKFVWFECVTSEVAKAKAFYTEVIGWKVQPFVIGDETYEMATAGETPVGGYATPELASSVGQPPHWTSYVSVDDVDDTAKKIWAEGGSVLQAPFDVPKVGRMARAADPQGAGFWLMGGNGDDPADTAPAHGLFHWNELHARDVQSALRFYEKVFGYTAVAMEMAGGAYHLLEKDGVPRAGVTPCENGAPPMWLPYVAVDDCDAAVARAVKRGGAVRTEPTDVPDMGRFAVLADVNGAVFAVVKPAALDAPSGK